MGLTEVISNMWCRIVGKKTIDITMWGLDASGKTSILYFLMTNRPVKTCPTIGFNKESIDYGGYTFVITEAGGGCKVRPLFLNIYKQEKVGGLILVVDSTDRERIEEVRCELNDILEGEGLREAAVVILANKQDSPYAMSIEEVTTLLKLASITRHEWHILPCSATQGHGMHEALDWIAENAPEKSYFFCRRVNR